MVARQAAHVADVQNGKKQIERIVRMMMGLSKRFLGQDDAVKEEVWKYDLDFVQEQPLPEPRKLLKTLISI